MFSFELFHSWQKEECKNYNLLTRKWKKKGYRHFDPKIFFPDKVKQFENLFSNKNHLLRWSFLPLIKIVTKTPRYRHDEANPDEKAIDYKERPISFASHKDALLYSFAAFILSEKYEKYLKNREFSNCVCAYRKLEGKNNIDFAYEVFEFIKAQPECVAIALDIRGFYDSLNHEQLFKNWKLINGGAISLEEKKLFDNVTRYSYVHQKSLLNHLKINLRNPTKIINQYCSPSEFRNVVRKNNLIKVNETGTGIPQGLPLSSVLSNIYMVKFDQAIQAMLDGKTSIYRRYCDDILIVCPIKELDEVLRNCKSELSELKLEIQDKKKDIVYFIKGADAILHGYKNIEGNLKTRLQYLGFEFNGNDIFVRSSSLSRYYRNMKENISKAVKRYFSNSGRGSKVFRKNLFQKYTHLGIRNFIKYCQSAQLKMNSQTIKIQISRHMSIFNKAILDEAHIYKKNMNNHLLMIPIAYFGPDKPFTWENVKQVYIENHLFKELKQPMRRINALRGIQEILISKAHYFINNPETILKLSKKEFKDFFRTLKQVKKLNGADDSVLNGIYNIVKTNHSLKTKAK